MLELRHTRKYVPGGGCDPRGRYGRAVGRPWMRTRHISSLRRPNALRPDFSSATGPRMHGAVRTRPLLTHPPALVKANKKPQVREPTAHAAIAEPARPDPAA